MLAFVVARIALFIMKRNSRLIEGVIKDRSELPLLFLKSIKKRKEKKKNRIQGVLTLTAPQGTATPIYYICSL